MLPSSQDSDEASFPSPQVDVQMDAGVVRVVMQVKPYSTWHVELQPSLLLKFPSSHSPVTTMLSPQMVVQMLAFVSVAVVHVYPVNADVHVGLHPILPPVSQVSVVTQIPSPQIGYASDAKLPPTVKLL